MHVSDRFCSLRNCRPNMTNISSLMRSNLCSGDMMYCLDAAQTGPLVCNPCLGSPLRSQGSKTPKPISSPPSPHWLTQLSLYVMGLIVLRSTTSTVHTKYLHDEKMSMGPCIVTCSLATLWAGQVDQNRFFVPVDECWRSYNE